MGVPPTVWALWRPGHDLTPATSSSWSTLEESQSGSVTKSDPFTPPVEVEVFSYLLLTTLSLFGCSNQPADTNKTEPGTDTASQVAPPNVTIISPTSGGKFYSDQLIDFAGLVTDTDGPVEDWTAW